MSVCSPVSSPRLQSWCSIFLLGVSVSVSGLPFTQKCKTRLPPPPHLLTPATITVGLGTEPLLPRFTFFPPYPTFPIRSAASPMDSSWWRSSLSVPSVSVFLQALILHLHCYIATYQVFFVLITALSCHSTAEHH